MKSRIEFFAMEEVKTDCAGYEDCLKYAGEEMNCEDCDHYTPTEAPEEIGELRRLPKKGGRSDGIGITF